MSGYDPYEKLVNEARPHSGLLKLLSGVMLMIIGVIALQVGLVRIIDLLGYNAMLQESVTGATVRGTLLALFSFIVPLMVLWVVLRVLHDRSFSGVLGNTNLAIDGFSKVMVALVLLTAALLIFPMPEAMRPVSKTPFGQWLVWAPLGVVAVLLQVSSEEFIFRGYLQSQLAARFRHPAIWILVPSAIFAVLHYAPGIYGENALLITLWAFAFGVIAADLTARSGTLGPAIAVHFVNNVIGILIVGTEGHLSGMALAVVPFGPDNTELMRYAMLIEVPMLLCMWLAARIAIRR